MPRGSVGQPPRTTLISALCYYYYQYRYYYLYHNNIIIIVMIFFDKTLLLSFEANFSFFSLAESPPRDLQITVYKQWSGHAQRCPTVFGCK